MIIWSNIITRLTQKYIFAYNYEIFYEIISLKSATKRISTIKQS